MLSRDLFEEQSGLKIIEKLLLYLYSVKEVKPGTIKDRIGEIISKEKGEIAMSTAELLVNEGMEKKALEDTKKMLYEGLDESLIQRITDLSIDKIHKIKEELDL